MDKIPSGTYKGQDEDIATFGIKALLCVRADLDEDLVYEITSILYENRDRLKDLHPPSPTPPSPGSCSTISRSNCMPELSVL